MESSTQNKKQIYDPIRSRFVASTPEELVRQALLHKMIHHLFYPKEWIAVEKSLAEISFHPCPCPNRRIDIACFAKNIHAKHSLYPLLLIECKESDKEVMKALEQVKGYNLTVQAYFIAVAYPGGEKMGFWEEEKFQVIDYLPSYPQLMRSFHG